MPDVKYKVYPSGYLGSNVVQTTKPIDIQKIKEQLFNLSAITNPDGHTANLEVVRIEEIIVSGDEQFKKFEFKERVIAAALLAFGNENVYEWIQAQRKSPYFSDYHAKYIDETLLYVFAGKPRQMSKHNWTTLLQMVAGGGSIYDTPVIAHVFFGEALKNEFSKSVFSPLGRNYKLKDLIVQWVRQPGGIEDLTAALHILFGNR